MAPHHAVLFDLDGTLTDSKPGILNCLRKALDELQIKYDGPLERFIGPPVDQWATEIIPDGDESARQRLVTTYRKYYDQEGWAQNSVYPGIPEMLSALHEQGISLYVCTSKGERFARRIVDAFEIGKYFKAVYGDRPEYDHRKESLIARVLKEEKLAPIRTFMVGDRCFDVDAAHANKLRAIGVTWGYGSSEELVQAGAEMLCSTPNDVLAVIVGGLKCVPEQP